MIVFDKSHDTLGVRIRLGEYGQAFVPSPFMLICDGILAPTRIESLTQKIIIDNQRLSFFLHHFDELRIDVCKNQRMQKRSEISDEELSYRWICIVRQKHLKTSSFQRHLNNTAS